MKIQVTEEHIRKGHQGSATSDPVSLALRAVGFTKIFVGIYYIRTAEKNFETPEVVLQFMRDFDNGVPVKPFEFELEGV